MEFSRRASLPQTKAVVLYLQDVAQPPIPQSALRRSAIRCIQTSSAGI